MFEQFLVHAVLSGTTVFNICMNKCMTDIKKDILFIVGNIQEIQLY